MRSMQGKPARPVRKQRQYCGWTRTRNSMHSPGKTEVSKNVNLIFLFLIKNGLHRRNIIYVTVV